MSVYMKRLILFSNNEKNENVVTDSISFGEMVKLSTSYRPHVTRHIKKFSHKAHSTALACDAQSTHHHKIYAPFIICCFYFIKYYRNYVSRIYERMHTAIIVFNVAYENLSHSFIMVNGMNRGWDRLNWVGLKERTSELCVCGTSPSDCICCFIINCQQFITISAQCTKSTQPQFQYCKCFRPRLSVQNKTVHKPI